MIVRAETPDDASSIRRVTTAAFGGMAEADLVEELRAGGHIALSLVAEHDRRIVGHVLFSRLVSPETTLALAPVSVIPELQTQGIGSRLIREGLEIARRDGWLAAFVVGEPAYYRRFGFRSEVAAAFETPYPQEYVMAVELEPGAMADVGRKVVYPAPFAALG